MTKVEPLSIFHPEGGAKQHPKVHSGTVSRRNLCDAESLAKALRRNLPLSPCLPLVPTPEASRLKAPESPFLKLKGPCMTLKGIFLKEVPSVQ